jgi:hypothetical protein
MIQSCSPQHLKALQPFNSRLGFMAGITNGFKIRIIIGTPMSLGLDVVNRLCCDSSPAAKAVLAQMVVSFQDARTPDIPLATVATLVATLSLLMLLPAFIAVLCAVA